MFINMNKTANIKGKN